MNPFGRHQESEADYLGIIFANLAGYDPAGAVQLWERMQKEFDEGQFDALDNLMRSHPYSEKRAICTHEHILKNYGFDCNSVEK
jgi:predicted Zn-dependent protease